MRSSPTRTWKEPPDLDFNAKPTPIAYRRTHGITCFHVCYSVGDDQMCGPNGAAKASTTPGPPAAARPPSPANLPGHSSR